MPTVRVVSYSIDGDCCLSRIQKKVHVFNLAELPEIFEWETRVRVM